MNKDQYINFRSKIEIQDIITSYLSPDPIKVIISYYRNKLPFEDELLTQTKIINGDLERYRYGYNHSKTIAGKFIICRNYYWLIHPNSTRGDTCKPTRGWNL